MADDVRQPRPRDLRAARFARDAAIRRAENTLESATRGALGDLVSLGAAQLRAGGYDPSVLDVRHPEWGAIVDAQVLPSVVAAYAAGLHLEVIEGTIDATGYAMRHVESVRNRLVGVGDEVFDVMRGSMVEGFLAGEGIPELASRVDGLLSDDQRWTNRARTIARTEVIGANNAGQRDAARYAADVLGEDPATVVKQWLSTSDSRTRATHLEADGQQVVGIDTPFEVGGSTMQQPGDPAGDPGEVVNCRCTVLHLMPGDPGYPDDVASLPGGEALPAPAAVEVDPGALDDAALEDEMLGLAAAGDYTSARAMALAAELDRRDAVNLDALPEVPDAVAEQVFVNQALVRDLTQGRQAARRTRGKSESREAERADYEAFIDSEFIRAEMDTQGYFLTPEARRAGVDARDLFTRRLRSLPKYATEELQRWFAENGRHSFDQWRGRRAKTQGWESEFG